MNIRSLTALAAFACCTTAALGQEAPPIPITLSAVSTGVSSISLTRPVTGFFVETFETAALPAGGTAFVSLIPGSASFNLFAALLNDQGFGFPAEDGSGALSFQSAVAAGAPLSLTVLGFAGNAENLTESTASYTANIRLQSVAVIPEPETYALLLAGLWAVAAGTRRVRRRG